MSKMEKGGQDDYLTIKEETDRVARLNFAEQQERESQIAEFLIADPDYQQAVGSLVGTMVELG